MPYDKGLMKIITVEKLSKNFGELQVLEGINLRINKGDIYGLVGASGAGKSTLLRCINGLATYDQGSLKVGGTEVSSLKESDLREFRKNMGMIFQHFSLLERRTVYENIALPMECWKYNNENIGKKVRDLLELVGLQDKINSRPRELSGGQKQRVAIARALTMNPQILLCDEATSALDPNTSKSILELLKNINEELGLTVVVVAHQMSVVKQICNKMAILSKGIIVEEGNVGDIFLDYPVVLQELLGESNYEFLPKQGINIKILLRGGNEKQAILSNLAISTNVKYSFVWGGMDKYRDNILGSIIINVNQHDLEKVSNYLNVNSIEWEELNKNE